jgi:hypothetical protein
MHDGELKEVETVMSNRLDFTVWFCFHLFENGILSGCFMQRDLG